MIKLMLRVSLLIGSVVVGAAAMYAGYSWWTKADSQEQKCAFCKSQVLNAQTIYEGQQAVVLYTHKPIEEGHCLVIPKRHVQFFHDLNRQETAEINSLIKKVHLAVKTVFGAESYLLLQKNGASAGQTVPHVHFHYIPQDSANGSVIRFARRMICANLWPALKKSQMQPVINKLRDAMLQDDQVEVRSA